MKTRAEYVVEYALLRFVAAILSLLPYRAALTIGWLLARISWCLLPRKMRTAEERIRRTVGRNRSDREVRKIAWLAWRNLVFGGIEMLRSRRHTMRFIQKVIDYRDVEKLLQYVKTGKRVILAVPHMGSWEMAGVSASLFGAPLLFIVREQKNPLINAYLNRMRSGQGQEYIDRDDPSLVRSVLRRIKEGRVLAILPDIRARTDALHVRFLNGDATVAAGMGLFARQTKTPILPACTIREGWARHRWIGFEPIEPDFNLDKTEDWHRMTQAVLDVFTKVIEEHPEQYFWFNKKWVLDD